MPFKMFFHRHHAHHEPARKLRVAAPGIL